MCSIAFRGDRDLSQSFSGIMDNSLADHEDRTIETKDEIAIEYEFANYNRG